ncbi:MAG: hypothetical protein ACPL25_01930 [Ignavibacteria bacterium]
MKKLSLIFISLVILIFSNCSRSKDPLPEEVYQLSLVKTISGREAKDYINKLHFQPVTENENLIGHYENASGNAVVYVTLYKNEIDAKNDFIKMTQKISPENSVFIYPQFFDHKGNKIYKCFGMGMTHYVFVIDKKLYWISVDTHFAKNFFNEFYNLVQ